MGNFVDNTFCWNDLAWAKSITDLPIILKDIQTAADAYLAVKHGANGITVSNHGGRSLDTSPPAIFILLELQMCCPEIFQRLDVCIDGGVRRGTSILKCLCLGATAVGLGRLFLYALNCGAGGVEHMAEILRDELEMSMRMIGLTDVRDATPEYINTLGVNHLIPQMNELLNRNWPFQGLWKPTPRL